MPTLHAESEHSGFPIVNYSLEQIVAGAKGSTEHSASIHGHAPPSCSNIPSPCLSNNSLLDMEPEELDQEFLTPP